MKVITEKVINEEVISQMMSERVSSFRIVPRGPWSRRDMAAERFMESDRYADETRRAKCAWNKYCEFLKREEWKI